MFYNPDPHEHSRFFQRIEVRIGEDDPGDTYASMKGSNTRCSTFWNNGKSMKYYDFKCPGIKGKYVTITSQKSLQIKAKQDLLSAAEVEIFGKQIF